MILIVGTPSLGRRPRPNLSMMQSAHQASQGRAALTTASTGAPWWSGARQPGSTSATSRNVQSAQASAFENRGGSARLRTSAERQNSAETSRGTAWALPSGSSFGGYRQAPFSGGSRPDSVPMASVPRYYSGGSFSGGFGGGGSFGSFGEYRGGSFGGGSHTGGFSGGFHGGGGSFGGGSHGGGFSGGGNGGGGGGHR